MLNSLHTFKKMQSSKECLLQGNIRTSSKYLYQCLLKTENMWKLTFMSFALKSNSLVCVCEKLLKRLYYRYRYFFDAVNFYCNELLLKHTERISG